MMIHRKDIINSDPREKRLTIYRVQKEELIPYIMMLRQKCQGVNALIKNEKN